LIGLYFVPDAQPNPQLKLNQVSQNNKKVKVEVEEIKKLVTEKAKELEEKGLQDMAEQMQALAKQLDREKGDHEQLKKEAMIKINDLRQQLEERQKEMGDAETIKSSLEQLKKVTKGPGEKMAEAMSQGDLEAAKKAVEELAQKLANGELTEMEKKQLAENLQKMADEVKKMQDKVAQQKAELEKQRDQAQQQGNSQKAADLQKQIDQLQKQQQAMNKMGELAKKLEQAANAMQQNAQQQSQKSDGGEPKPQDGQSPDKAANEQAQQALQDLAEEMQKIEADMESMEALKDLEDDLRECRDGMGKQIDGDNPNGQPNGEPMWKDWAKEGKEDSNGGGKRDIQENETGEYRSRVAGKIQKGETVISGTADGDNLPGKSLIEVRDMVQASMSQQTDPLEDQQLPKNQREHARQYFESLRKGK
jgi:myosin heavy subunit